MLKYLIEWWISLNWIKKWYNQDELEIGPVVKAVFDDILMYCTSNEWLDKIEIFIR